EEAAAAVTGFHVDHGPPGRALVELGVEQAGDVHLEVRADLIEAFVPGLGLQDSTSWSSAKIERVCCSSSFTGDLGSRAGRQSGDMPSKTLLMARWILRRARK